MGEKKELYENPQYTTKLHADIADYNW